MSKIVVVVEFSIRTGSKRLLGSDCKSEISGFDSRPVLQKMQLETM